MRKLTAIALCLALSGCNAMTNEEIANAVAECKKLGLGARVFRNALTIKIFDIQCDPEIASSPLPNARAPQ